MSLRPPQDLSLRAKRSNLQGTIASNGGDCFVAPLLAMTARLVLLYHNGLNSTSESRTTILFQSAGEGCVGAQGKELAAQEALQSLDLVC